jgi:hypothetical protein
MANIRNVQKHKDDRANGVLAPDSGNKIKVRRIKYMNYV